MNPLCCIAPVNGPKSVGLPETASFVFPPPANYILQPNSNDSDVSASESPVPAACGVLYKWVNYGRGWRSRWFVLDGDGVLSYYKIHGPEKITTGPGSSRVIGDLSIRYLRKSNLESNEGSGSGRPFGEIHLKVSSVRVSRSDDKRLSIFTGTKTLHLRCESREDRAAWTESLNSVKGCLPRAMSSTVLDVTVSTEKMRARLSKEGVNEAVIRDCESIMISEFSELQNQFKNMKLKHLSLLETLRQIETEKLELEAAVVDDRKDADRRASDFYSVLSDASASDSEVDLETDEGDRNFDFLSSENSFSSRTVNTTCSIKCPKFPYVRRRSTLPEPKEKENAVGLWSIIKDSIGKDLSGVCLPVYFNEPLSSLQKCFEDLEFSYLIDNALQWGKQGNDLMRILNVAAFAVSAYASTEGRQCKPFNPLLGETYEADYPDKGLRFISEKVSHHPMIVACHCDGRGWKFWGDSNLKGKFWGRSIQLDPVGILTLQFDDGETFQWSKVTTSIYNIIIGKIYCDHYGTMRIQGSGRYSCKVKFKEQSIIDRNPHQVHGFVHDNLTGEKVALLVGKWDEAMYYVLGDPTAKPKNYDPMTEAVLLWEKDKSAATTRYNLTPFAISLNELTAGLAEKLPASDSRLRPDQRSLENGEYERANEEKLRLEHLQRQARNVQEGGWKPRWFEKDAEGCYLYKGGYWEARESATWNGVSDLFNRRVNTSSLL